jgi:D-alanyl-D-alanine carboxypeptidase
MASTTKIMTAAVVLSSLSVDTVVSVPPEAVGVEGTSAYLKEGERLTVLDLLYALLLGSANDAAVTLAVATDGSVSAFAAHMNEVARELGLTQTNFENPHGLPDESHKTTAYELALITAYALRMPRFAEIVGTKRYRFRSSLREHTLTNHNRLLSFSEEAIGVKTGFTKKSGRCLVGAVRRDGTTLVSVTLSAPDDWRDHMTLWDYGFTLLGIPKTKTKTIS